MVEFRKTPFPSSVVLYVDAFVLVRWGFLICFHFCFFLGIGFDLRWISHGFACLGASPFPSILVCWAGCELQVLPRPHKRHAREPGDCKKRSLRPTKPLCLCRLWLKCRGKRRFWNESTTCLFVAFRIPFSFASFQRASGAMVPCSSEDRDLNRSDNYKLQKENPN